MTIDDLWSQVKGLPDTAKMQVPEVLTASTKKKLGKRSPQEIAVIVAAAIDEVNRGSVKPLDELIKKRL